MEMKSVKPPPEVTLRVKNSVSMKMHRLFRCMIAALRSFSSLSSGIRDPSFVLVRGMDCSTSGPGKLLSRHPSVRVERLRNGSLAMPQEVY
jgi:hypothetical protein